jgi:transcriptional regulator with XRE-family HTH domain
MSLADVSRLTGIDRAHLSRIETLRTRPQRETIEKLAGALGCRANDLDATGPEVVPADVSRRMRWRAIAARHAELPPDVADAMLSYIESFFELPESDPDRLFDVLTELQAERAHAIALRSVTDDLETGALPPSIDQAKTEVRRRAELLRIAQANAPNSLDVLDLTTPTTTRQPRYRIVPQHETSDDFEYHEFNDGGTITEAVEWEGDYDGTGYVVGNLKVKVPRGVMAAERRVLQSTTDIQRWPIRKGDLLIVERWPDTQPLESLREQRAVVIEHRGGNYVGRYRRDARGRHIVNFRGYDHIVTDRTAADPVVVAWVILYVVTQRTLGDEYGPARNEIATILEGVSERDHGKEE